MALGSHVGPGSIVGIDDPDPGGDLGRPLSPADHRHLTGRDAAGRGVELVVRVPELAEVGLPGGDDLFGCRARDSHLVGLLPQLAEALQRPGGFATLHVALARTLGDLPDMESVHRLCPILSVPRLGQLGPFSVVTS